MDYKLIRRLYEQLRKRRLKAGERVFAEGDSGDFAYIIEEGEIEISTIINGQCSVLNILGPGSMFGELALVDGRPRSASAYARTDVLLTLVTLEQVALRIQAADPILRMLLLVVMRYFRVETSRFRSSISEEETSVSTDDLCPDLINRIAEAVDLIRMESELRAAIHEKQFKLYYQPIVNLENLEIIGFEALIRWQSPSRGFVPPDCFIPLAESTSLIIPIGQWIIEEGMRALKIIQKQTGKQLFMSFNIASRQIEHPEFVELLLEQVHKAKINPGQIKLEILERSFFDGRMVLEWMHSCRNSGFLLSLDDFGTGYSSLQYLNESHLDTLKIDKSFVENLDENINSQSICQAIIELSRVLGITVIAEGIEKPSQADFLRKHGCSLGQGYYFARPLPLDEVLTLFTNPRFNNG
jgi:diguanylate cyclase